MVALRLNTFGGMLPAVETRLLPDVAAAYSKGTFINDGSLRGFRPKTLLRAISPTTKKVYRIPNTLASDPLGDFGNSTWMEFSDRDTDVLRTPVTGDTYHRYYWCSPSVPPRYNSLSRIQGGQVSYKLGIPAPATALTVTATLPSVSITIASPAVCTLNGHGFVNDDKVFFSTTGALPTGLVAGTGYYVRAATGNTFEVALTAGGTSINTSGTQSGVHTVQKSSALQSSRAYVHTYISTFGEEGPPSAPVVVNGAVLAPWMVTVPAVGAGELADRSIAKIRVYRTVTGNSGVATYYYVAESTNLGGYSFQDTYTDAVVSLNSILESTTWQPPPALKGMVMMPHGMMVGWSDESDIWFSEPFRPHAWPAEYGLTVDSPIVGIGVTGNSLVVATRGHPVVISGIHPAGMSQVKLGQHEPCLSRRSIVSTDQGVYFTSLNGLIGVTPGGAQNVSANALTKEMWLNDVVAGLQVQGVRHLNSYVAIPIGIVSRNAFLLDAGTVGFNWIDLGANVTALQEDFFSGETLVLVDSNVYMFDPPNVATGMEPFTWRSKIFTVPYPMNLSAMRVTFTVPAGAPAQNPTEQGNFSNPPTLLDGQHAIISVIADGNYLWTKEIRTTGEVIHNLPGGFKATEWQFEIISRVIINSVEVASTPRELRSV